MERDAWSLKLSIIAITWAVVLLCPQVGTTPSRLGTPSTKDTRWCLNSAGVISLLCGSARTSGRFIVRWYKMIRWEEWGNLLLDFFKKYKSWSVWEDVLGMYPSSMYNSSDLESVSAGRVGALLWRCWRAELASPRQERMSWLCCDVSVTLSKPFLYQMFFIVSSEHHSYNSTLFISFSKVQLIPSHFLKSSFPSHLQASGSVGRHPFGQRIVQLLDEFKLVGVNGVRILFWRVMELFHYINETVRIKVVNCEYDG